MPTRDLNLFLSYWWYSPFLILSTKLFFFNIREGIKKISWLSIDSTTYYFIDISKKIRFHSPCILWILQFNKSLYFWCQINCGENTCIRQMNKYWMATVYICMYWFLSKIPTWSIFSPSTRTVSFKPKLLTFEPISQQYSY